MGCGDGHALDSVVLSDMDIDHAAKIAAKSSGMHLCLNTAGSWRGTKSAKSSKVVLVFKRSQNLV